LNFSGPGGGNPAYQVSSSRLNALKAPQDLGFRVYGLGFSMHKS